jgi:hypothetical protein
MSSWGSCRSQQPNPCHRPAEVCRLDLRPGPQKAREAIRLAANARHFVNAFSIFVSEDALIRELDLKALGAVIER